MDQSERLSLPRKVSFDLLKQRKITAAEQSKLIAATSASGVGVGDAD